MTWDPPVTDFQASGVAILASNLNKMGNSLLYLEEVAYVEFTSQVSVTATAVGSANQIVSAGAINYEAVPHLIEFECSRVSPATTQLYLIVRDGTTVLGTMGWWAASGTAAPMRRTYRLTPTAASHTYNLAGWLSGAGTANFESGSGGAAGNNTTLLPGFIRITRIPT